MIEKIAEALYNARYIDAGDGGKLARFMFGGVFDYKTLVERVERGEIQKEFMDLIRNEATIVAEALHPVLLDAKRWNTLMTCGRLRVQGSADFDWKGPDIVPRAPDAPLHMGVEFWDVRGDTEFLKDEPEKRAELEATLDQRHTQAISALTNFVDELIRRKT